MKNFLYLLFGIWLFLGISSDGLFWVEPCGAYTWSLLTVPLLGAGAFVVSGIIALLLQKKEPRSNVH